MFAGFNLKINKDFFESKPKLFSEYQRIGEKHLKEQTKKIKYGLEKYVKDDIINGSKVQSDWFPEVQADIFLSHSHADEELVNAIAGWLNDNFNLKCFVDSNVWNYAGDLCEALNAKYSNKRSDGNGGYLYNHNECQKVSEHVNIMLNIALQRMIDKCESIFLINTEQSIHINRNSKSMDLTYSPWIYSELVCSEIVRKRQLAFYRYNKNLEHSFNESKQLPISYDVSTQHLIDINKNTLEDWRNEFYTKKELEPFPLDVLYEKYFKDIVKETRNCIKY